MAYESARILILCKTYPSPSSKYAETSCVAGISDAGELIRLYPIPFRMISEESKFKKWQWITAKISKTKSDHRKESHRIGVDTIICEGNPLSTKHNWVERRSWLDKLPIFRSISDLEADRKTNGTTLGLLKIEQTLRLEITRADQPKWTEEEQSKLLALQNKLDLFDSTDRLQIKTLRKIPYNFHYCYELDRTFRHKIVDWEIGALYWNTRLSHGDNWEKPFREKIEQYLPSQDLFLLMGNIHRFPNQWLAISLIYPPKVMLSNQGSLFD